MRPGEARCDYVCVCVCVGHVLLYQQELTQKGRLSRPCTADNHKESAISHKPDQQRERFFARKQCKNYARAR